MCFFLSFFHFNYNKKKERKILTFASLKGFNIFFIIMFESKKCYLYAAKGN